MDAKEQQKLQDGTKVCWLTITDEKSCGLIEAFAFDKAKISEVPIKQLQKSLIELFTEWGKPLCIKIDNGRPLADPTKDSPLPPLALWLISLDIQLIFNRSYTPTDNAKVERMQGVSKSLAEPRLCQSLDRLNHQLKQACIFQRRHYPTRTLKKKTRVEVYPQLDKPTDRPFNNEVDRFKVFQVLTKYQWTRKVTIAGQISFMGKKWQIGQKYTGEWVSVQFNSIDYKLNIVSYQLILLKAFETDFLSNENIANLSIC